MQLMVTMQYDKCLGGGKPRILQGGKGCDRWEYRRGAGACFLKEIRLL